MDRGLECIGIRRGWSGLINGDIERMDPLSVSHIIDRGGTVLYTARSEEFRTPAGQEKAYNNCKFFGLDGVIAIGGDGHVPWGPGAFEIRRQCHRHPGDDR